MELRDERIVREDVYFDTIQIRRALDPTQPYPALVDVASLRESTS